MPSAELAHLQLLADVDALIAELGAWADRAGDWPPARRCRALVGRLAERAGALRVRLEAPLVVATLGGTGTGKSSLVNALVGAEVSPAGRQRPTTRKPTLVCREDLSPEQLGIDPAAVDVQHRDLPALRDLVLLDCPDPDTTEHEEEPGTNLARLRALLPHCDVLLVTSTQQKYRSARVADELATAATGARLVFVQTHADVDEDIRADWRRQLAGSYEAGDVFFVDSLGALADAREGLAPRGEFARLTDLLTRELAGAAGQRIRRANFLDLVEQTLALCEERLNEAGPALDALETAIADQRAKLSQRLAAQMRQELLASRRHWENRLLGEAASRWGLSPFALVLRAFQGLGGLLSGAWLMRVRTPGQLALWGAIEGGRRIKQRLQRKSAEAGSRRAVAWSWDDAQLRTASIIIDGYAADAGLPRDDARPEAVAREAEEAGGAFVESAAGQVQQLIGQLAARNTGWFTRWRYELALLLLLVPLLYRLGRNYFYDSWLAPELGRGEAQPLLGLDFFLQSGFWLLLWCLLLVGLFTARLRRGLRGQINRLAEQWAGAAPAAAVFADLEGHLRAARHFTGELERLKTAAAALRHRVAAPPQGLGHAKARPPV